MDLSTRTEFLEDVDDPPDPDVVERDPLGRYIRYKEVLGEGAFKTVYKGFDQVDGIEVAWSQVDIDAVVGGGCTHDLKVEVNLLNLVNHRQIIKMYKWWVDDDAKTLNMITELFNSGSVRQYRMKHKKVDMKAVKGWARQILLGLDYLHNHSPPIIHRDVKCDNIFINGNHGQVKIGDFGLATVMDRASLNSVWGTPAFMAPEIYNEDYNELVDIYSFGMCMLEMTTNECPYSECTNHGQIYKKVCGGIMPASLSKVTDLETKKFIERCLGPASERLPAKELLKDPFLRPKDSGAAGAGHCCPGQDCAGNVLALNKKQSYTEQQHMLSENRIVITSVESHPVPTIEVQSVRRGKEFKLKGKKEDENTVSFNLRISNSGVKDVDFSFYLQTDTAESVASEMMMQLAPALAGQSVLSVVTELIDVSIRLIHDWKPCVPIDHPVATHQCAASISNPRAATPGIKKFEDEDIGGARHKYGIQDRDSDAGTFSEENYIKSSTNTCGKDNFENKSLSLELEMIELKYQQALEEISKKRQEAITEVIKQAALPGEDGSRLLHRMVSIMSLLKSKFCKVSDAPLTRTTKKNGINGAPQLLYKKMDVRVSSLKHGSSYHDLGAPSGLAKLV